jgi:hypothetical protein
MRNIIIVKGLVELGLKNKVTSVDQSKVASNSLNVLVEIRQAFLPNFVGSLRLFVENVR